MLTYELTLAGLAVGSAAALSGIGLIVTYKATGVLNLAHGALAMICAYVLRHLVVEWHWPLPLAAAFVLLLFAPALGLALDRTVFRTLTGVHALVATVGVFILLIGTATLLWGTGARADAPQLLPADPWIQLGTVLLLTAAVAAVTRWTRFGYELRAVVDDRALAGLTGIHAGRVAAAGWAFGTFTAGLSGVLLAPQLRLDPYGLPLLVMEVMAVAVAARLRSMPVAVAAALAIGVTQSQLTRVHPDLSANLFALALLLAALALPSEPAPPPPGRHVRTGRPVLALVAGVLTLLPLGFAGSDLRTSVQVPALAVILLSLVVLTGQISLGQAAYAGLGALGTALLSPHMPNLLALALSVLLVAPLGLATGWRRQGLALALTTLAISLTASRFVLERPHELLPDRPAGFGDDRAYYALELVLLAAAAGTVALLRRGRFGRALAAVGDGEQAAAAAGVAVPRVKLTAFVTGAALAALGGGMLTMGVRAFDAGTFDPVRGLLWFAALFVLGSGTMTAALTAAALLVALDAGPYAGWPAAVIGVLAVLTGRVPALRAGLFPALTALLGGPDKTGAPEKASAAEKTGAPEKAGGTPARGTAVRGRGGPAKSAPVQPPRSVPAQGLVADGVTVAYDGRPVLRGLTLAVPHGAVTALTGPNGAGKSTLFHCLAGTLRPLTGRVLLDGRDVTRLPPHARTRLGVARTFQQPAVFPSLTVAENVRLGAEQGGGARQSDALTRRALRLLALEPLAGAPARGLPTAVLRRVELARALATDPHTLLLDEPTAGLDTVESAALGRLLRALAADGTAVLLIEHDLALVGEIADTVHHLEPATGREPEKPPDGTSRRSREPSP